MEKGKRKWWGSKKEKRKKSRSGMERESKEKGGEKKAEVNFQVEFQSR